MPHFSIPGDVVFRELAGESVLLRLDTGIYFGLNAVGTRIWQLLVERGDKEKVIQEMLAEFEVSEQDLRRDVEKLVQELCEKGLLIANSQKVS